ncbi:putative type VI secretion system effector [Paraburkholderia fungorum]|uniref:Uncharacterized protein n=1 Tax=Paraburkholderia fungorum TaxID=134537 RepID=A0AAW3UYY5_9BURK|nr:putative type VI secretion system effector [Paraburkholderia fungorum]MBB4515700.1 hypothetical protein [Paraburkholderia fungorum]MBB6203884.1 hypothetical protein [Paraburkholderia fungorum]
MNKEISSRMELLRGTIANLRIRRRQQDFVMSEAQHEHMEATAAGAALLGMGASAIGLLNLSANSEEEADWVEFDLDGTQVEGWLWKMPVFNGDEVEIVAERRPRGRYFVYSLRRPEDGVVAVYPHATAGRSAQYRSIMKMMLWCFFVIYFIFSAIFLYNNGKDGWSDALNFIAILGFCGLLMFWGLFYISYRKLIRFSYLAEAIFSCYGWANEKSIDLIKSSKGVKPTRIAAEYGLHYFIYDPERAR